MDPTNSSIPTSNPVPGPTPVPDPVPVPPAVPGVPVPPVDLNGPVPPSPVADVPPVEAPVVPPSGSVVNEGAAMPSTEQSGDLGGVATELPTENTAVGNEFATPASTVPVPPVARPTNIDGINSVPTIESDGVQPVGVGSVATESASVPGATGVTGGQSIDGILNSNPFAEPANTPSVSFADPTTQPEVNNNMDTNQPAAAVSKKKSSKAVLITLSIIAFVVAAVLGVVLVMMLTETGPFGPSNSSNSGSNNTAEVDDNGDKNNDDKDNGDENGTGGGGNGDNSGVTTNPGEDTIVCTMVQDDVSSDGGASTSTITMTLYFTNNNFSRVSLHGETTTENSTTPAITTMEMTAAELLEMGGIDWDDIDVKPNEDGSVAATKDQVMSALNSSYDGMTCINPSSM